MNRFGQITIEKDFDKWNEAKKFVEKNKKIIKYRQRDIIFIPKYAIENTN